MRSSHHEALIDQLCEEGWQRPAGWKENFIEQVARPPYWGMEMCDAMQIGDYVDKNVRFIPDAYRIKIEDEAEGWGHSVLVLELAEVVVSHHVPVSKLVQIEDLWRVCDATEYTHLRLYVMDRYKQMNCVLDLEPTMSAGAGVPGE